MQNNVKKLKSSNYFHLPLKITAHVEVGQSKHFDEYV